MYSSTGQQARGQFLCSRMTRLMLRKLIHGMVHNHGSFSGCLNSMPVTCPRSTTWKSCSAQRVSCCISGNPNLLNQSLALQSLWKPLTTTCTLNRTKSSFRLFAIARRPSIIRPRLLGWLHWKRVANRRLAGPSLLLTACVFPRRRCRHGVTGVRREGIARG